MKRSVLTLVAVLVIAAGSLTACDMNGAVGQAGLGCRPLSSIAADNSTHTVNYDSLISESDSALDYARTQIDATDMNTTKNSLSAATDAHVMDAAYTTYCGATWVSTTHGGLAGLTTCVSLNSANECEQHEVRVSTYSTSSTYSTTTEARNTMLHEMGHSIGLDDQQNSSDVMYHATNSVTTFSTYDRKLINDYY